MKECAELWEAVATGRPGAEVLDEAADAVLCLLHVLIHYQHGVGSLETACLRKLKERFMVPPTGPSQREAEDHAAAGGCCDRFADQMERASRRDNRDYHDGREGVR